MKTCIIVDAYRFSKDFIYYLNKKGVKCIHVQSSKIPLAGLIKSSTYQEEDYIANFIYEDNLEVLAEALKKYYPSAVIAGTEIGVTLADRLMQALNLRGNDFIKTNARRNKFDMIAALADAGVACMKYMKTHRVEDAIAWIDQHTTYPVVLKPLESGGTEDVYVCITQKEVIEKFACIINKTNCLGLKNEAVLVQEFLRGTEYMVNSVSANGDHYFTDIWACQKKQLPGYGMIYDREVLLPSEGKIQLEIKAYLTQVLDALGFRLGAAHAELIYTERGPILIEVGARVGGNVNCVSHTACVGVNQVELVVDALFDREIFEYKTQRPYHLLQHGMTVLLSTTQEGVVSKMPILEDIENCPSLYWYGMSVTIGDYLKPTRDLFSSPGKVILLHKDESMIYRDYDYLMRSMPDGFIVEAA